ncbi:MAG: TlyA family RNA methyltransferase [Pyrinomonadaceae bacterium]|nr:TlyA family RNA methyltransferase [Blastocatellia bacterium]MDQ3219331.1 TlyA family RNA methyltransferase [Acidobacteriota bacterium]MDQ3489566.1 TlyA family RNA methyltransferase [Acidobacteriota bacterium]
MKKERIDKLLQEFGFVDSSAKARALVMAGSVLVNEKRVNKPSESFPLNAQIRVKGETLESRYVGRGGLKLEKALSDFHICPDGYVCLDVGSSTGGFTDCLLKHGAGKVVAIDVGTNQIVWGLRNDPRVEVRENTNARNLATGDFNEKFDIAVMDVSFISVKMLLPVLIPLLKDEGKIITLIKPQFEVGKGEVGNGGIVREPEKQDRVVYEINQFALAAGLRVIGVIESPIFGAAGNREFLALYGKR